ncbi:MAG: c-type cytochrome [Alteromonadaceae bacterium]|nr:c-type cytochrome [Alteromonadaceae bacterium]
MAIAIVIVLLVIGSLIFHYVSPWWFTPLASNWGAIDDTINITLWVTGIVFVLVNLFLAYVVFRFQYNKNRRAHYEPENTKLEGWLTAITAIGVAGMLAPGLFVWASFINVPQESDVIEVVGQQWHWSFRLPGNDGELGRTAIALISEKNPFGLDTKDSSGQDDILILSNEMHIPIDRPVKVLLRSKDVLHNFAVPQFRVKMDLVPGTVTYLWFKPTKIGRFEILCEELCGVAHYTMRGSVVVDSAEDYQTWLSEQQTFAQSMAVPLGDMEKGWELYAGCAGCHGAQGEGIKSLNAPRLAGMSSWYTKRQLAYFQKKIRGTDANDTSGQLMSQMSQLLADKAAINDVAFYINSLKPDEAAHSSTGDLSKGKQLFRSCSYCHGEKAEGNFFMNAPKLSGQHDWYLSQQLNNYKKGIRGNHPFDLYGSQMMLMSRLLHDEKAILDVVSYIGTLDKGLSK